MIGRTRGNLPAFGIEKDCNGHREINDGHMVNGRHKDYLLETIETLVRYFFTTSKEAGHVDSRHVGAGFDVVDNHRVEHAGG